jgi:hypothetical protein
MAENDRLVAVVETEFWSSVGGPSPYHDSYTFSLYTGQNRSEELQKISELACSGAGARITHIYIEQQYKEPHGPWWGRLLRKFGVRFWRQWG